MEGSHAIMTAPDWFKLGLRLLGAWLLTRAMPYLAFFVELGFTGNNNEGGYPPAGYLIFFAFDLSLALFFLFGARHLTDLCYKADAEAEADNDANDDVEESPATE